MNRMIGYLFFLLIIGSSYGQFGKLGKKLKEKAGDVVKDKLTEKSEEKVSEYDTTSFNYAIAFLDKSESFENKQKGESLVKAANFLLTSEEEESEKEKARNLFELGRINYVKRSYKLGEIYLRAAKLKYEDIDKTADPVYLKTLGLLGQLHGDMGRFEGSEKFTTRALEGWKEFYGENSPGFAAEYNNLAVLQLRKGKYRDAEKQLKKAIQLVQDAEGESSVPHAIALNNLGILYVYMGRLDDANELLTRSIQIADNALKEKSGTYLQLLTNKALIQQEKGNYDAAEKTYKNALDLQTSRLKLNAKSDPDYAHMLNNLASLYMITDRTSEAKDLLVESLEIYKNRFGSNHPLTASAQADLGNLYRYTGHFEKSEELLRKALQKRKELLGDDHPNTTQSLEDLAVVNWKLNKTEEAADLFDQAVSASLKFINDFFPPLSEVEKTQYWNQLKSRFYTFYNFAFENADPELLNQVLRYRVATKGLLLNSSTKIKNTILSSDNEELKELYRQWVDQKRMLSSYYSLSREEIASQNINIDSLEDAANQSERKLSELSSEFTPDFVSTDISTEDLAGKLKESEKLVEIIQFPIYQNSLTNKRGYAALIIQKDSFSPELLVMDREGKMDSKYFSVYKNLIRLKSEDEYSYRNYWKSIDEKLGQTSDIYFSPDGVFNQLNINTLRKEDGSFVIEDRNIRIIGNPGEIIDRSATKSPSRDAFLVGFPSYGSSEIVPLPGTKKEVNTIQKYLKNANITTTVRTEETASESAVKSVTDPRILHIATHGFFLEDSRRNQGVFGVQINYASNNPLLRSGLMLAGASNDKGGSFSEDDDGILTSYEALNLSLNDTDLVVLSACETGKGDIQSGEGVYGLQRAFTIAGTRQLIMSLWKVDDEATQQLMSNFYNNWVVKKMEISKAFRTAQLNLIEEYEHPYYWGAFILVY